MNIDPGLFEESERTTPQAEGRQFVEVGSLDLERGGHLGSATIAYQTWGKPDPSNAILVCHAISGDSNAVGWWPRLVGPGKAIDTDRYWVICSNVIGGCQGSTGPLSGDFPFVTLGDMVEAQSRLMDHLSIPQWQLVCGGSMGGMQAIEWARRFPSRTKGVWATASALRHSAMQIGFNEVARQSIFRDPRWQGGNYTDQGPTDGLAVARMLGHLTYLSEPAFEAKFGRRLQEGDVKVPDAGATFAKREVFQVENYLAHQGHKFTERFDARTFVVVSNAIDTYDCTALPESDTRFLFTSFTSDLLYPSWQSQTANELALGSGHESTWLDINSPLGHDAFLLDENEQASAVHTLLGN
ncbi:MAG: homoserine O-acetyltransferase [Chthonomonas sp.]|nr:homoserine O-acetyltransferase [Chthonomonas sp.]